MKSSGDKQYSTMTYREWLIGMALAGGKYTSLGAVREANRVLELLDEEAEEARELDKEQYAAHQEKYQHQKVVGSIVTRPPPGKVLEGWTEDYLSPDPEAEALLNEALQTNEANAQWLVEAIARSLPSEYDGIEASGDDAQQIAEAIANGQQIFSDEDDLSPDLEAEARINEALRASEPTEDIRLPKQVDAFPLPRVHETATDSALSMWRWECPHCYVRLAVGQNDEGKKMLVKFMNEHSDCEQRAYEGPGGTD